MAQIVSVTDVFKSTGQPTITYVERDEGRYEHLLSAAIDGHGHLCLITGPSKTGKSTLYKRVLETKNLCPVIVRCDRDLVPTEFWRRALEQVNFSQLTTTQSTVAGTGQIAAKVGGIVGWKWLAGLTGELSGEASGSVSEGDVRQKILASPSPHHLIPILKTLPTMLIVEDFHYLTTHVQAVIFQQWKSFIDNEISVIVLGTTHHAVDIANSNRDLIGRIVQIDVARWKQDDLQEITRKGFSYLQLAISSHVCGIIARESAGLPIITQQTCEQMFIDKRILTVTQGDTITFSVDDAHNALYHVATGRYAQLDTYYTTISRGPRRKARKYNTYELVLTCFAQEPLQFSLTRHEIDERLRKLPVPAAEIPPAGSLTSMLKALEKFQTANNFELLEWRAKERMLYIVEPSFLFYLRWRKKQDAGDWAGLSELIEQLMSRRFDEIDAHLKIVVGKRMREQG